MNTLLNLVEENIENLKSLWKVVSEPSQGYWSNADFAYCFVGESMWPNRLWFHQDIQETSLQAAKSQIVALPTRIVVPYWDIYDSQSCQLLEQHGFAVLFEQVGMALQLRHPYSVEGDLEIRKVSNSEEAHLWSELFQASFGYWIHPKLIAQQLEGLHFLTVFYQKEAIGTALLFHTGKEVLGIHCVGVIPSMRRRGFAEQLMKSLLNEAVEQGFQYVTLQASQMGKGLYEKLGFEEQFLQKNYAWNISSSK